MAVLDTTVLIDLNRRPASPLRRKAEVAIGAMLARGEVLCTTRINEAELRVGAFRAKNQVDETARIESVLSTLLILEFDADAARHYAGAKAHLLNIGRPTGSADLLIAAIALAHRQTLLTRDPRHFANIPGLHVESY